MFSSLLQAYYQLLLPQAVFPFELQTLPNLKDDPRLALSPYQDQYAKNFETLKPEYKDKLNSLISYVTLKEFLNSPQEKRGFLKTVYCFLCALAFYEINNNKPHSQFSSEDWENFSLVFKPKTPSDLQFLSRTIFQSQDSKSTWTSEEDLTLKALILFTNLKNFNPNFKIFARSNPPKRLPWKKIAEDLNQSLSLKTPKKPSQCSERWKNFLSKKCRKGEWSKSEDLMIISFVIENGSKWSQLAKLCPDRTEHNVKNRFFSLLSKQFDIPILKIKQSFNYLDKKALEEVKQGMSLGI